MKFDHARSAPYGLGLQSWDELCLIRFNSVQYFTGVGRNDSTQSTHVILDNNETGH